MARKLINAARKKSHDAATQGSMDLLKNANWGQLQKPFRLSPEFLVPFAPRWLRIKDALSDKDNIRNKAGFHFELGWRKAMWEYFPIPQEGNVLYNLAVHWDWFIQHPPKHPATVSGKLLNAQPTGRPNKGVSAGTETRLLAKPPRRRCILEPMGWYEPAHYGRKGGYGIHLSQGGLVNATARVHMLCPDEPRDVVLAAICHFVYCHEVMHAWIEDICALLDFYQGCSDDLIERQYSLAYRRWGGLLLLEESVCDMAAFGLLRRFLVNANVPTRKSREIPVCRPKVILEAIASWIEARSDHRFPFVPISHSPTKSRLFISQLTDLFVGLYGYQSPHDVITNFLGLDSPVEGRKAMQYSKSEHVDTALNASDDYPVTVHLE